MTINGIVILASQAFFSPTIYGILIMFSSLTLFVMFLGFFINFDKSIYCIMSIFFFILMMVSVILVSSDNTQTILNKYYKTQYTIEILDDNAWKELGPNYTIIEKPYETKEIYIIEGDYAK